jgi:PAS domain S-box-containing protein
VPLDVPTVLAPLVARLPDATILVTCHDRRTQEMLVVAAHDGAALGLDTGTVAPLDCSFCTSMIAGAAPAVCANVSAEPVYAEVNVRLGLAVGSYAGAPVTLPDGTHVGSVCALSGDRDRFAEADRAALARAAGAVAASVVPADEDTAVRALRGHARRRTARATARARVRRTAPFAAAAVLAFATLPLSHAPTASPLALPLALLLAAVLVAAVALVPWERLAPVVRMAPAYGFFAFIAALREAEGGAASGLAVLVLLPVLWIALHGDRRELVLAVGAVAVTLLLPVALVGDPGYPVSEVRRGLVSAAVALLIGHGVQHVVQLAHARSGELRERARELHASEEDKRLILATAGEGIVGVDADGAITFANPTASALTGHAPEHLLGRPFHVLLADPEDCEVCEAMGSESTRRSTDGVFRTAAGARFPAEYVARPFRRGGAVAGAVVTFSDVTERRRAERALLEEREFLRALLASLREGIVASGPDGRVELANDAIGDGHEHLLLPDGRTPLAAEDSPLARAYRGEHVRDVELVVAAPHAEPRTVVVNGQPVVGREGRRLGAVMTLHDITERRRAEQAKDEFIALVSHELRTPLTSILGYLEVLVEEDDADGLLPPHHRRFLTTIERNAHRLERLVGDLLFVAQLEAGRLALEPGQTDLAVLAKDAVDAGLPRSIDRGVFLRLGDAGPAPCAGDAGRLGQVVDNLVANALKFTGVGGSVTVSAGTDAHGVWFEVADTGIGIPADELDRLFERFFRASSATEREIPGVGLGLAISKAIVEGHDGRISVRSTVGEGTTFRVTLPAESVALAA